MYGKEEMKASYEQSNVEESKDEEEPLRIEIHSGSKDLKMKPKRVSEGNLNHPMFSSYQQRPSALYKKFELNPHRTIDIQTPHG